MSKYTMPVIRLFLAAIMAAGSGMAVADDAVPEGDIPCVLVEHTMRGYDGPIEMPTGCLVFIMDRGDWIVLETVQFGDGIFRSGFESWPAD